MRKKRRKNGVRNALKLASGILQRHRQCTYLLGGEPCDFAFPRLCHVSEEHLPWCCQRKFARACENVSLGDGKRKNMIFGSKLDMDEKGQADRLAGRGAKMAQISEDDSERITSWDNLAWHIQRRLLAVLSHRARLAKDKGPRCSICFDQQLARRQAPTDEDPCYMLVT